MDQYRFLQLVSEFLWLQDVLRHRIDDRNVSTEAGRHEAVRDLRRLYAAQYYLFFDVKINLNSTSDPNSGSAEATYVNVPDSINVKLIDSNLLETRPWSDGYSSQVGAYDNYRRVVAVTLDPGTDGWYFQDLDQSIDWESASGGQEHTVAPTIGEQLLVKRLAPQFLVTVEYTDIGPHSESDEMAVVIYRDKKFDFRVYHEKQFKLAQAAITKMIEMTYRGANPQEETKK